MLVDPKTIAKALGAQETNVKIDSRRGPISPFLAAISCG